MKVILSNTVLYLLIFLSACNSYSTDSLNILEDEKNVVSDSLYFEEEPEYMYKTLYPIRAYVAKIDSINNWSDSISKDIFLTTEGGKVDYYFLNDTLKKIKASLYGESFQKHFRYYIKNDTLVFVHEKQFRYNRPIYWDSTSMKEMDDDEVFDFDKSSIIETESYFENGNLIRSIDNQDCGDPYNKEYRNMERKRILEEFDKFLQLIK